MKKIFLVTILLFSVILTGTVLAREPQEPVPLAPEIVLPELPNPGLVPGNFWYFLDGWGESIRSFFIFNRERKAIFETERALERIAEVNALLEEKGVDAPGLDVAEAKIQRNMIKVNGILERQRARGIEIAQLAKRLESDFDVRQDLLESVFDLEKVRLDVRKKEIRLATREARAIHNFEKLAESRAILDNIKAEKERLDVREDSLMAMLDIEEEKMEIKMEVAERELDALEDEMENLFDEREREMKRRFEQKERALWLQEETLEIQLREAVLAGDMPVIEEIETKIIDLEAQEQAIDQEQEVAEIILEQREDEERGIIDMRERALEQIKDAREEIFDAKEEITEMMMDRIIAETPVVVLELLIKADEKLSIAEQAFNEGDYGKAFGQAMRAEMSIIAAERILEQKEEEKERLEEECRTDEDCEWFGGICMSGDLIDPEEIPLPTAPPTGYKCICKEGRCMAIRKEGLSPDLIVERFLITRFAEDGVEIRFSVKNIGDAAIIDMVNVKFINLENNQILKSVDLPGHPPIHPSEGRTTAPRRITGVRTNGGEGFVAGKNRIQMIVDYRNKIKEANENNNEKIVVFDTRIEIEEKLEEVDQVEEEIEGIVMRCQTDWDCRYLICPMVIGYDTPQCGPDGFCFCGPGENFEEISEKVELTNEVALALIGIEECDLEGAPGYYASCIMDISKEKDYWVVIITHDGLFDDSVRAIRLRAIVMHRDGQWVKGEISHTQKCWPRRGHQYFSTKLCI